MDEIVKKELKATSKKAVVSSGLWVAVLALVCCGGPIVLLVLLSGGAASILGFLFSSIVLITAGISVSILAIVWFATKIKRK